MTAALVLAALVSLPPADTIVVGTLSDPSSLAPHRATDLVAAEIVTNVCETLVRLRPGLAAPGGRARHRLGHPRPARLDPDPARGGRVPRRHPARRRRRRRATSSTCARERAFPGRAERVVPHVVEITLDRPNAALLSTLSQPFFAIQSPRRLAARPETPVGTGPFRLAAAEPGRIELAAVEGHWAGTPRIRRLVFRRFADEDALARALASGEADVTAALGPDRAAELRAGAG